MEDWNRDSSSKERGRREGKAIFRMPFNKRYLQVQHEYYLCHWQKYFEKLLNAQSLCKALGEPNMKNILNWKKKLHLYNDSVEL
ncbi:hypothetical protein PR048_020105 [Dryococelus australis]|uniref:Uncharacterized protein n=1 Tax=Dryococelus australis TaxID=614101 RepID=A0ABQ9H5C5_9NEOP|nr:hypothetical protein PR048_020105 [Dryococelus australis]